MAERLEPPSRFELETSSLPKKCSTPELWRRDGGECRIRTYEGVHRQIYSLFPLATRATPQTVEDYTSEYSRVARGAAFVRASFLFEIPVGNSSDPVRHWKDGCRRFGYTDPMTDFYAAWSLSRGRFDAEIEGLTPEQMAWRLYPGSLTIAEAAIHVAGVEAKFGASILGLELDGFLDRVRAAATDGVVNDRPFPFSPQETTPELVVKALSESRALIEPALLDPTPERRAVSMVSALGPVITGEGAMARLGFHAGYHQGQVYLMKNAPGFPANL